MAVALSDPGKCSTATWPNTVARCSTSTKVPASRFGPWSIAVTKRCVCIGIVILTLTTSRGTVPCTATPTLRPTTRTRISLPWRPWYAGTITGANGQVPESASVQVVPALFFPIRTRITGVLRTIDAVARSMRCVFPRMPFMPIRSCGTVG
ncbi:MAG: hypothetical protein BWY72_02247 [Bacteroidetes bacterium ADurb.Bin416]|nr:MAG: hypothetical protein BWY72_02247 [Bacteroidetes bacterium ADurb.Bin416]